MVWNWGYEFMPVEMHFLVTLRVKNLSKGNVSKSKPAGKTVSSIYQDGMC